jgi:ParB-like chromosome segregation protein Spo0J
LTKQALSRLELGEREPTWHTVRLLAAGLGVDCREFVDPSLQPPETEPARPRGRPKKPDAGRSEAETPAKKTGKGEVMMSKRTEIPQLPSHPAADLFPMMSEEEFQGLKADIDAHGQHEEIVLCDGMILDGRNRYRACRELKCEPRMYALAKNIIQDPFAFVLSANLHRRHLNGEQKRAVIGRLLQDNPKQSNRQLAEKVGVDHHTVAYVRREKERTGEIPQLQETVGKDGRSRSVPSERANKPQRLDQATEEDIQAGSKGAPAKENATAESKGDS